MYREQSGMTNHNSRFIIIIIIIIIIYVHAVLSVETNFVRGRCHFVDQLSAYILIKDLLEQAQQAQQAE